MGSLKTDQKKLSNLRTEGKDFRKIEMHLEIYKKILGGKIK